MIEYFGSALYHWAKIYPLVSILLFFLAFSVGLRGSLHGWMAFLVLILISAVCFLLDGFFYGALQVLALIFGSYYYYRLGRKIVCIEVDITMAYGSPAVVQPV